MSYRLEDDPRYHTELPDLDEDCNPLPKGKDAPKLPVSREEFDSLKRSVGFLGQELFGPEQDGGQCRFCTLVAAVNQLQGIVEHMNTHVAELYQRVEAAEKRVGL